MKVSEILKIITKTIRVNPANNILRGWSGGAGLFVGGCWMLFYQGRWSAASRCAGGHSTYNTLPFTPLLKKLSKFFIHSIFPRVNLLRFTSTLQSVRGERFLIIYTLGSHYIVRPAKDRHVLLWTFIELFGMSSHRKTMSSSRGLLSHPRCVHMSSLPVYKVWWGRYKLEMSTNHQRTVHRQTRRRT